MQRRALIVGNWKMNGLIAPSLLLATEIQHHFTANLPRYRGCDVVLCPPFTALHALHQLRESNEACWQLGAQNLSVESHGAHTGEICGAMLRDVGCQYVLVGHSERRTLYGETDQLVAQKVFSALRNQLWPIVCLGENLVERQQGHTLTVLQRQLEVVLSSLIEAHTSSDQLASLTLAYEPVWAIGTGHHATAAQVAEVHDRLRQILHQHLPASVADAIRLLYGGSVKPDNASALLTLANVDGGLVGGASLQAADFVAIVDAAVPSES
ncbi:MAG: triose-phosphate isomerase [Magnetococcales bacterium]|nr:triose-phosphate isomerase [Magnetococcales bacterium]